MDDLRARVERWIADDPDPEARAELRALLDRARRPSWSSGSRTG